MDKRTYSTLLLTAIIAVFLPIEAFSQKTLPLNLGKEYLRSELTAIVGTPERFSSDFAGEDYLHIQTYGKGIILNQLFTELDLKWEEGDDYVAPIVDFQSKQFTGKRAALIGIALTDPTYRILEDKIPGGLYVGMPRTALKAVEGRHTDGWPVMARNNYRIVFEDESMVLMYYNAWDRVTFIEYISPESGIFSWLKEDPYTPVDEKDQLVTSYHGPDDLKDVLVPSDPADIFARFSAYNLEKNPARLPGSEKVSLPSLLNFAGQTINDRDERQILVQTNLLPDAWRGLKAVIHDSMDSINWNEATEIRWTYLQQSNRAVLNDYIVAFFARKGYEAGQTRYSFQPETRITQINLYMDLQGDVRQIRCIHSGRIHFGRLLKPGEELKDGDRAYRHVTVYREQGGKREIIGTYRIAEEGD